MASPLTGTDEYLQLQAYVLTGLREEKHFFPPVVVRTLILVLKLTGLLDHMPKPEPITVARRRKYADWLSLGHMTSQQVWN